MLSLSSLSSEDTLSDWLKKKFNISQNQLKKFLNKKQLSLKVESKKELQLPIDLMNSLMINPIYEGPEIKILNEDSEFLVLSKPFRVHCHPLKYTDHDNILSFLRENNYYRYLQVNTDQYDRSLVYRLDYETSGLLVLANRDELYNKLRKNFHQQVKTKIYIAICEGDISFEGNCAQYFKDFGPKGQQQKVFATLVPKSNKGEMTISKIAYNKERKLSLVKVELKTGLRHQIRAGMYFLGNPILGDELYGGAKSERLFLHAYEYKIEINSDVKRYRDTNLSLFNKFFDLNSLL